MDVSASVRQSTCVSFWWNAFAWRFTEKKRVILLNNACVSRKGISHSSVDVNTEEKSNKEKDKMFKSPVKAQGVLVSCACLCEDTEASE